MTDYEALLRSVIDRPDDDTPRLVLADWCDDQSDPGLAARAAFIRAQVKLAEAGGRVPNPGEFQCRKPKTRPVYAHDYGSAPTDHVYTGPCGKCDWCGLTREAAEAFAAMPMEQKQLTGVIATGMGWRSTFYELQVWRRGFPEVLRRTDSDFWRQCHATILAAAPIRRVEFLDVPALRHHWDLGRFRVTFADAPDAPFVERYTVPNVWADAGEEWWETASALLAHRWPKVEFVLPYGEVPFRGSYEEWAAQPHVRAENERRLREGREGAEAARRLADAVDRLPRPPA